MPKLYDRVRELLASSPIPRHEIARALDRSEQWVRLVEIGRIKDPGVNATERMYELLSGREINLDG